MLDTKVETFLCVCKHMNYTKASKELNITQPAVSQQIRALEEFYEVPLFHYVGKKLSLSEEGEQLYHSLSTMVNDEKKIKNSIRRKKGERKKIAFGVTMTVGDYIMQDDIIALLKEKEYQYIKMEVANTHTLLEKLQEGSIDFAFVEGYFNKEAYDYIPYRKETFVAACGYAYPIAKEVSFDRLLQQPLLVREVGSGSREILSKYLDEKNASIEDFQDIIESNSIHAIKEMMKKGYGISFLYKKAIEQEIQKKEIQIVQVEDFPLHHDITFIWRKDSLFSKEYRRLFQQLQG